MIFLRDDLPFVDQRGELRFGCGDPAPGVFRAARVLRHRDDFEIPAPKFFIESLPTWQVETAASPRGPGDQENFLATKISERMQLAVEIRKREVRRFE